MAKKESYSKKIIEAYKILNSFIVRGGRGMPPRWPISIIETNWYHSQFWAKELYSTIQSLEKRVSDKKIAKLLWGPSTLSHWFYIANPVSFEGLTPKESEEFLEKTINFLSLQRQGDIFCRDWTNRLLTKVEVKKLISVAKFINGDVATILAKINVMLWHYCILIQVGHRSYSQEFHGPYDIGNGENLFIRDYFNLRSKEVWKFTGQLPFNRLRFFEVYQGVQIKIDMFNHFEFSAPPSQNLRGLSVLVDDSKYLGTRKEVGNLFNTCEGILEKGNKTIKDFSKKDWIKKIIEMRHLWLKPRKEILGKDWRPNQALYDLTKKTDKAEKASMKWFENMRAAVTQLPPNQAEEKMTQMFLENIYQIKR